MFNIESGRLGYCLPGFQVCRHGVQFYVGHVVGILTQKQVQRWIFFLRDLNQSRHSFFRVIGLITVDLVLMRLLRLANGFVGIDGLFGYVQRTG